MKKSNLTRPDKLLVQGFHSLSGMAQSLYSLQKQEAKANAELTHIGEKKIDQIESQLYKFNEESNTIKTDLKDFDFLATPDKGHNYWLNFHGIHNVDLIEKVGNKIGLERLTLRQILDTTQRPKLEQYERYLFISIKSTTISKMGSLEVEQISFVLGKHFVITFQEMIGDHFDDIRDKMQNNVGFIRKKSCDYLLNQLWDAILDNSFETIENMNQEVSDLEKEIYSQPTKSSLIKLESLKAAAQSLKKSLNPMKEALQSLLNYDSVFTKKENLKFFKDLASSTTTAIEEADTLLRSLEALSNIYFASLSQNMNEVMKVLTIVATIFIPLTFIAGIYGMNFENMPELRYHNGYFIAWGVMILMCIGMIIYFKKKKWI